MAKKIAARKKATAKAGKKPGSGLGISIFVLVAVLVAAVAASAVAMTFMGGDKARGTVVADLRRSSSAQSVLQQERYRRLELAARAILAEGQLVPLIEAALEPPPPPARSRTENAVDEDEPSPLVTLLERYRGDFDLDMAFVLEPETGALLAPEDLPLEKFTSDPLYAALAGKRSTSAVARLGDKLYHVHLAQLVRDFELAGVLGLATSLDPLAGELKRTTGAEVVLWVGSGTGPAVLASTDAGRSAEVIAALRREGQGLTRVERGETAEDVELELGGQPWIAFLTPLRGADERPLGAVASLVPVGDRLALFGMLRLVVLGAAGAALLVGLVGALVIGGRALAPLGRLAAATRQIAGGNLKAEVPDAGGGFKAFVEPLRALARHLADQDELRSFLADAARRQPEGGGEKAAAEAPQARQAALLVVDMQRFAHPKLAYDPDEHCGRYAHDLRRLTATVGARQGSVEAIFGHRVLALFDGETGPMRAVTAATEVLLLLSTRENAFDEPVPPIVALNYGAVVTGPASWGTRTGSVVAGLPMQQLESLLREATPGEVFLARPIAAVLAESLKSQQIGVRTQRGIVSPQPVYVLDAANAQRFTGVAGPPAAASGADERLTLADVAPGVRLGERFEVLRELGKNALGPIFAARDSERGEAVRLVLLRPEVLADGQRFEHLKGSLDPVRYLTDDHALPVLDFAEVAGLAFVAMPHVPGLDLGALIAHRRLPVTVAYLLGKDLAAGLAAAHRARAVHGGLKPSSVVVEAAGDVRIVDFGLTIPLTAADRDLPYPGAAYLSPEQLAGQPAQPVSDVYAWGAVFYAMVTGRPPADGKTPSEVAARRQAQPVERPSAHCPELPAALEQLVLRCLAPQPGGRYGSFDELLRDLESLRA